MSKFEYDITQHSANQFREVVYFCTEQGECDLEKIPSDQIKLLQDILNARGQSGWELVHLIFGKEAFLAFWKRQI